ncbi:MAG: hypothetical protein ACK528_06065 [Alphaproteobacteria bacterium]|jgi:hypothetical protein
MYAQHYAATKEVRVSQFIRQFHRWVSAFFVLSVIATTIALAQAEPIMWMSYVSLLPLAFLALSDIYLFVQPNLSKRRTGA